MGNPTTPLFPPSEIPPVPRLPAPGSSGPPLAPGEEIRQPPGIATALTLVAGILILVEGVQISTLGGAIGGAAGGLLGTLGGVGVLSGVSLLVLTLALWMRPQAHLWIGIAVVVLVFVGLFGGGGYLIGFVLGLIGGILAIVYRPD